MCNFFSIHRLDYNITDVLSKIVTANLYHYVNAGLSNKIIFTDEGTHISGTAEIKAASSPNSYQVYLSSAYCQLLWLISDYAIKSFDYSIITSGSTNLGVPLIGFFKVVDKFKHLFKSEKDQLISSQSQNNENPQDSESIGRLSYFRDLNHLKEELDADIKLATLLLDRTKIKIDCSQFSAINYDGQYEGYTNAVYSYGISFILLHELSHFSLGHMDSNDQTKQQETDADMAAFWDLYSDLKDKEQFTANVGILCVFFSFILIDPTLPDDSVHPSDDDRLFAVYDEIKDDNPKYTELLIYLFNIWAQGNKIKDYPTVKDSSVKSLSIIRNFIMKYRQYAQGSVID